MKNLPNYMTIGRIVLIPLIIALFFAEEHQAKFDRTITWAALLTYVVAAVTDYLDGHLARALKVSSNLGKVFDPIADKLLVGAVLFLLVAFDRLEGWHFLPALVILLREILVSGLREYLVPLAVALPVTRLAKWKTGFQMTALGFLIGADLHPFWYVWLVKIVTFGQIAGAEAAVDFNHFVGIVLLWLAAALTLVTGWGYLRAGLIHIAAADQA